MKSFHTCGSAVLQDAEASFQVICSHSSVPDCLESVPLSPSHPQQKKTCNNSNRRRQPNKYLSERLAKTHNPSDGNKSLAKLRAQIAMIVCIGLRFVMPVISPVCYDGIPCHLLKRDKYIRGACIANTTFTIVWDIAESCCVKLLSLCVSVSVNEHRGLTLFKY